ncbi:MAG: SUMF1/EgtB/PvdO family nonheme iron enzyme [Verrucomicrobia bacterium]|nr:SUMF1/EgtB/PvdO family nonheme iron enzyme [Verrucomicrobiota bacterium]MDA1006928.1 SUMF1/EgtB/PvdO family nonheme iron enzyme [Verrucomicrobiota bacterium]
MTDAANESESRLQMGDYLLGPQVKAGLWTVTYVADQISVRRKVLLECVRPNELGEEGVVEAFLADVRAKAALDFPVVSSVYEAVRSKEVVFYTREKPPGRSLEELHGAGETLEPRTVLLLLERIGEAFLYLGEHAVRTEPIQPGDLFFEKPDVLRIDNLAVSGLLDEATRRQDRQTVSILLSDLVALDRPAATRTKMLLELLAEEDSPNWASVAHTAGKLAHELADDARLAAGTGPVAGSSRPALRAPVLCLAFTILLVVFVGVGGVYLLGRRGPSATRPLNQMVAITGAKAFGPDGEVKLLPPYWIDAHEVTIAEYGEFLKALSVIAPEQRGAYDHPKQPAGKDGHVPEDWAALLAAAEEGGTWQQVVVDSNCPVVNIDWWDAYAYANWRGGRLPSQAEWFAAAEGGSPEGSGWGPVDLSEVDRTASGVQGLAGNVTEWIGESVVDPAYPMNPVSCGASYRQPQNGSLVRLWHPSRETKRPDLGLRVLRETAP